MLNILPAIMLLLVQGMGDVDTTFRGHQALLDLAQRVSGAQSRAELEDLLGETPGFDAHQLASWIDVFIALKAEARPEQELGERAGDSSPLSTDDPLPKGRPLTSDRTRDGPSF